jgi:hypothetical protein
MTHFIIRLFHMASSLSASLARVLVFCQLSGGFILTTQTARAATNSTANNQVAVLDFKVENPTANTGERAAGLEDFFEVALQKQDVPVLERRNLRLVLAERNLRANGLLSLETLSQARLPAVDYFVNGSVTFLGEGEFSLTLSIIKADQATVESTVTRHGAYPDDWLPTMDLLAKDVSVRLQHPKQAGTQRSEFEMMTWLPEAALPFFKGLDYYSRGDYALAVPWFRDSYEMDRHFDIARHWEARSYYKLNLPQLAKAVSVSGTNDVFTRTDLKRPVAAVVASGNISAAGHAAFLEALAQSDQFELFDPASIGATAREIDLQLTGQMAAPLNDRSVWLVVDDLIYLDAPDSKTLVVRQQNLLSGEIVREAKVQATQADETNCSALAKVFVDGGNKSSAKSVEPGKSDQQALPEPMAQDRPEVAFAKTLRLAAADPQSAKLWIGLADFYPGEIKKLLLEQAVSIIATNRQEANASYWLAAALWREREMTRRIFYLPTATRLAPNPLTNDFSRLLQWFPESYEAKNLVEVTNHGEGSYIYTEIKDHRYLDSVFDQRNSRQSQPPTTPPRPQEVVASSQPIPAVTEEKKLARLRAYLRDGRTAPAWQLVNSIPQSDNFSASTEVKAIHDGLLKTIMGENDRYGEFTAAVGSKNLERALELGRTLLNCYSREQRMDVIEKCGQLIGAKQGDPAHWQFVFSEAKRYRDDFLFNPVTGGPSENIEYQLIPGTTLVMRVDYGPDGRYERLVGEVAENAHLLPPSDLTADIFEQIRNDENLPRSKRLTAAFDLAMVKQGQGNNFEALELLKDLVSQTEGADEPLVRSDHWSESVGRAAFTALRKIRIYADTDTNVCVCCGIVPDEPPQKPVNFEEINRRLGELWKQQIGEAGTNLPPVKQQLLADPGNFFPAILYKLRMAQEVSHTLIFCADLGTNALPALPVIAQIIRRGGPFQDYNNALNALAALGSMAGCAKPLLILAQENADNGNFQYAFKRIGPAPRRVMPQLAQLLYHKNPAICKSAALAIIETAVLDPGQFNGISEEQQVTMIRKWWETKGSLQAWN